MSLMFVRGKEKDLFARITCQIPVKYWNNNDDISLLRIKVGCQYSNATYYGSYNSNQIYINLLFLLSIVDTHS